MPVRLPAVLIAHLCPPVQSAAVDDGSCERSICRWHPGRFRQLCANSPGRVAVSGASGMQLLRRRSGCRVAIGQRRRRIAAIPAPANTRGVALAPSALGTPTRVVLRARRQPVPLATSPSRQIARSGRCPPGMRRVQIVGRAVRHLGAIGDGVPPFLTTAVTVPDPRPVALRPEQQHEANRHLRDGPSGRATDQHPHAVNQPEETAQHRHAPEHGLPPRSPPDWRHAVRVLPPPTIVLGSHLARLPAAGAAHQGCGAYRSSAAQCASAQCPRCPLTASMSGRSGASTRARQLGARPPPHSETGIPTERPPIRGSQPIGFGVIPRPSDGSLAPTLDRNQDRANDQHGEEPPQRMHWAECARPDPSLPADLGHSPVRAAIRPIDVRCPQRYRDRSLPRD